MKGAIFQCIEECRDHRQFGKTMKTLQNYVNKNIRYPESMEPLFYDEPAEPTLSFPDELPETATSMEKALWEHELRVFANKKDVFQGNRLAVHSIILGQCSEAMQDKLKALEEYTERTRAHDCRWLLKSIKGITLQFDETQDASLSMRKAQIGFWTCRQSNGQSLAAYREDLRAWAATISQHGGVISTDYRIIPERGSDGIYLSI